MEKKILFSTRWYERRIHLGVLSYAQAHKWDVVSSHHMPADAYDVPDADGQIVQIGVRDPRRLKLTREYRGPVVLLEDFGDNLNFPRVHPDNVAIGRMAARHLLDRGFRRFATLSRSDYDYVHDRLRGFHAILDQTPDVECQDIKSKDPWKPSKGESTAALRALLNLERPAAVFCMDDDDAGDLIRHMDRAGIAVPEELAVLGVNDDPMICPFASCPISSVDPDYEAIGYKAAELLDRMMHGKKVPSRTFALPPKEVVLRRSTDIQALDDLSVAKALRFIWDHAEDWNSVGDIAAHVELPLRTLQWRFSKAMGRSLQDEVTRSRVERIKERLLTTDKSAKQIAEEMGFSSVQYLIRIFSKETGMSPLKFRRAQLNDPS